MDNTAARPLPATPNDTDGPDSATAAQPVTPGTAAAVSQTNPQRGTPAEAPAATDTTAETAETAETDTTAATSEAATAASFTRRDTEAEVKKRLKDVMQHYGDHPLVDEIAWLSEHYQRLASKLAKIARISDRLQSQVIDTNKALFERAASDPLTGLLNRAGMLQQIGLARERLAREGTPFGLLLIDLDFFKLINDRLGHAAGDRVLIEVAATLRTTTRATDACARWGGEEFLVLLPTTDRLGLDSVAEKLLAAISNIDVDAVPERLFVGSSIGTYLGVQYEPPEESIRRADTALYRAKRSGRGRVAHFDPALDTGFTGHTPIVPGVLRH